MIFENQFSINRPRLTELIYLRNYCYYILQSNVSKALRRATWEIIYLKVAQLFLVNFLYFKKFNLKRVKKYEFFINTKRIFSSPLALRKNSSCFFFCFLTVGVKKKEIWVKNFSSTKIYSASLSLSSSARKVSQGRNMRIFHFLSLSH